MPWKETDVVQERVKFVVLAQSGQKSFSQLCREFDVARSTGYRWLKRYLENRDFQDLTDRSRRPRRSPTRVSRRVEDAVVELRSKWGDGAKKLHPQLEARGHKVSVPTINRILKRRGLILQEDSHSRATGSFQKDEPNELWQVDFKGEYAVGQGRCYPLSMLDDHSRYLVGLYGLDCQKGREVYRCFEDAFEEHGVPEGMLMDHGIPWWSTSNGYGLTWLGVRLIKQGIKLVFSGVRHPQTQGKVERFHRSLKRAVRYRGEPEDMEGWRSLLEEYRSDYNASRPHEALSMSVPQERYHRSSRDYRSEPKEWEYPEGSVVKRLNTQGCLDHRGSRYFVCEALCGERVRVEEAEGMLLVSYRHMYVRQIDVDAGTTRALVVPASRS